MTNSKKLFAPNAVFVSDQPKQDLVLKEVYDNLLEQGYVKGNFLSHIVEREHNFPTGLDTSTLGKNIPNIAIPHTEGEFVNTRLIVPVSLTTPVVFHNMINPEQPLEVKFLFMLLDNDPDGQAELLEKFTRCALHKGYWQKHHHIAQRHCDSSHTNFITPMLSSSFRVITHC